MRRPQTLQVGIFAFMVTGSTDRKNEAIRNFINREFAALHRLASNPVVYYMYENVDLSVLRYIVKGPNRLGINRWWCQINIAVDSF